MNGALFLLIRLQVKGWVRRQFSGGSAKRTVFAILGGLMFLLWLSSIVVSSAFQQPKGEAEILAVVPLYITGFLLMTLFMGSDDRAIAFTPAEIDALFPGPFSRRELVLFKLFKLALASVLGGALFGLMMRRFAVSLPASMAGMSLALVFINLIATAVALLREMIEERAYGWVRRGITAALVLGVGGVVLAITNSQRPAVETLSWLSGSPVGRVVLAPGRVFAHVLAARDVAGGAAWAAGCVGLIAAAVVLVLSLDAGFMEAALAASERRQTRLSQLRKGMAIRTDKPLKGVRLRGVDALGPAGAVVGKQLITAMRTSRGWMLGFLFVGGYVYLMSRVGRTGSGPAPAAGLVPGFVMVLLMVPQMLRFDFRGDLDHIEMLKSLPISAGRVALAELAVPAAILSLLGITIIAAAGALMGLEPRALAMAALATPPVALAVMGLENFVFLMMPTRAFGPGQGGMAMGGRRVLMLLSRLLMFSVGGVVIGGAGWGAWAATRSVPATYAACWGALAVVVAGVVSAVAWAYARFDVSVDMPG